jgi:hypothetical protein
MDNKKLAWRGLIDALGVVAYIVLVVLFMNNAQKLLGKVDNTYFAPIIMLTLFVLSALVTGGLVLGKPLMLYLDGEKKAGVKLTLYTAASLAVIWLVVVLIYLGVK